MIGAPLARERMEGQKAALPPRWVAAACCAACLCCPACPAQHSARRRRRPPPTVRAARRLSCVVPVGGMGSSAPRHAQGGRRYGYT